MHFSDAAERRSSNYTYFRANSRLALLRGKAGDFGSAEDGCQALQPVSPSSVKHRGPRGGGGERVRCEEAHEADETEGSRVRERRLWGWCSRPESEGGQQGSWARC